MWFYIYFSGDVHSFLGNQTHKDHFKLLQMDGSSLLIGARNVIYNLSLNDLSENAEQVTLPHHISKACLEINVYFVWKLLDSIWLCNISNVSTEIVLTVKYSKRTTMKKQLTVIRC